LNQPHLLGSDPTTAPPPAPESIETNILSTLFVAFPLAAQMFQFHNLVIKAAGLPYEINDGNDEEDKKKLGAAANVVFQYSAELPNTYAISCALDALYSSEFNMKSVATSDLDLLRVTMDELWSLVIEDPIDEVDKDVLIGGMGVIDDFSKTEGTRRFLMVHDLKLRAWSNVCFGIPEGPFS
jgi:hypothetical protein